MKLVRNNSTSGEKSVIETVDLSHETLRKMTDEGSRVRPAMPAAFFIPHMVRAILDRALEAQQAAAPAPALDDSEGEDGQGARPRATSSGED